MPDTEPTSITAGDTLEWTKSLSDYSAADYSLHYRLRGPENIDIADGCITASGTDFEVVIPAATTVSWGAGEYVLYGWVTSAGGESIKVVETKVEIKPDFRTAKSIIDARNHNKRTLDAIEAVIEGRAGRADKSYTISLGGHERSLESIPHNELIALHSRYEARVKQDEAADRVSKGQKGSNKINIRITR